MVAANEPETPVIVDSSLSPRRRAVFAPSASMVEAHSVGAQFDMDMSISSPRFGMTGSSSIIKAGVLLKRRQRTRFYSHRWVEVKGGMIVWYRLRALGPHSLCSCRALPGCSLVSASRQGIDGRFVGTITVFLTSSAPGVKCAPLTFACSRREELESWMDALKIGSHWQFYRKQPQLGGSVRNRLGGLLMLEIVSGETLPVSDWGGTSDPYVIAEFDGVFARTKTIYKCLSPQWEETLTIPVFHDDPNWPLSFYIYDQDEVSSDDLLGVVSLPLFALGRNEEKLWRMPLKPQNRKKNNDLGSITVRSYYHTSDSQDFLALSDRVLSRSLTHHVGDFSIDLVKLQVDRLLKFKDFVESLAGWRDLIRWRRPNDTISAFFVFTIFILFLPDQFMLALFTCVAFSLLRRHSEYPLFYRKYMKPWGIGGFFRRDQPPLRRQLSALSKEPDSPTGNSPRSPIFATEVSSEEEILREENILKVWECERRNVAATAAALVSKQEGIGLFKRTFSFKNLKEKIEARWINCVNSSALISPPSTVENGFKYTWRVRIEPKRTDVNGWEYGNSWPSNWQWDSKDFSSNFLAHRHWVRRRLWVGEPVRAADVNDIPVPIELFGNDDGAQEESEDLQDAGKYSRGLMARYRKIVSEGAKIQLKVFSVANLVEKWLNWNSWKNPRITSFFLFFSLFLIFATNFFPQRVIVWLCMAAWLIVEWLDFRKRQKIVKKFLNSLKRQVQNDRNLPSQWKRLLLERAKPFTQMSEIAEITPETLRILIQRTCDDEKLVVKVSLEDFKRCEVIGELVESVYKKIFGRSWASQQNFNLRVNPKNLIKSHSIHDWERSDFYSHLHLG